MVANGVALPALPDGARSLLLPDNVGIPAGRNAGAAATTATWCCSWTMTVGCPNRRPATDSGRVLPTATRDPLPAHRGPGDRRRPSAGTYRGCGPATRCSSAEVTTFLGGASVVRRAVLDQVGGLPDAFFYAHEETDLAWRALDAGWRIRYDAGTVMFHPATAPGRHAAYLRLNARNRVWLARRRLPALLVPAYLGCWVVLTVARNRDVGMLRTWFAGFVEGWRTDAGERRPISWRTVWRMTRLGRPPVI